MELYGGRVLKALNRYELRIGVVVAAGFADKPRRTAFAVFGRVLPREEATRAAAELNGKVFERPTAMGVGRLDVVHIAVEVSVEGDRLVFGRFIQHAEAEKRLQECERSVAETRQKIVSLLRELRQPAPLFPDANH